MVVVYYVDCLLRWITHDYNRRRAKSHKNFKSNCLLPWLISSLFGFAMYLNAGLHLPDPSSYYIPALFFASFRLFPFLDLVDLPLFWLPALCTDFPHHLGTSCHHSFVYLLLPMLQETMQGLVVFETFPGSQIHQDLSLFLILLFQLLFTYAT